MRKLMLILLVCLLLNGCDSINKLSENIDIGVHDELDKTNYSNSYESIKNTLSKDELNDIRKLIKKKNEKIFWNEYLSEIEEQVNNVINITGLENMINESNVSLSYDSSTNIITANLNGLSEYSLPEDSVQLCSTEIKNGNTYEIIQNELSEVKDWFKPDSFWKFWEDEKSRDIANEYMSVIGDEYKIKRYTYKIAQKIFNAFQLLPEEYRDTRYLVINKENEKYYIDFYDENKSINFHIMQIQVDTDELINCLKGISVENYFKVDDIRWVIDDKEYSMNENDYKEVNSSIRYNESISLDDVITKFSEIIEDEALRQKVIDVLNYVREDIESHHRILLSLSEDYPEFEYLAIQDANTTETTIFAVNKSNIDELKLNDTEYLCNGVKLFTIDSSGKYTNYLKKAQKALYYNYYKWTLPPEDLGGDGEGNMLDVKENGDIIS